VATLTGKGECGFVDGQGVFRGPELPRSADGPPPSIAIMLGPEAFRHGKDGALGTLRHEMKHAEHFQLMIDRVAKWRASGKGGRFDDWVDRDKGIGKVERALLGEERLKSHPNTELLAYTEGFINTFHLRKDPPTLKMALDYPPAIYELRRMGEEYAKASDAVKPVAMERLRDYIKTVLTASERGLLKTWLTFLSDNARAEATNVSGDEALAAKLLHKDFEPLAGFFKQLMTYVP
jgi:hypothetical protein